jgi:hypothetical protein
MDRHRSAVSDIRQQRCEAQREGVVARKIRHVDEREGSGHGSFAAAHIPVEGSEIEAAIDGQ